MSLKKDYNVSKRSLSNSDIRGNLNLELNYILHAEQESDTY